MRQGKYTKAILTRVTPEEYRIFKATAKRMGISGSHLFRNFIRGLAEMDGIDKEVQNIFGDEYQESESLSNYLYNHNPR